MLKTHLLPRTSVGAFHLAYIEKIPDARLLVDSSGVDCMTQIEGDITGRTSKGRYEQLILEL